MNTLKYLSETVLPQEIRKNESLQKKVKLQNKKEGKILILGCHVKFLDELDQKSRTFFQT